MKEALNIIQQILTQPALVIGFLVAIGYIVGKKSAVKVITGSITAIVGLMMILFGGSQFNSTFKPIVDLVSKTHGIKGYIMDPYAMRATTQAASALGKNFGYVGYVFVLAFVVNLVLVFFSKYTKAKGIFLTGNTGIAHSQAVLWLVVYWFGFPYPIAIVVSAVLLGIFWAISTTLAIKPTREVTGGAEFTIGHNQSVGIWFFSKISRFFGNPEKSDAEHLKLPKWLAIFDHNTTAIALTMSIFVGGFLLSAGIPNVQKLAGETHWLIYILNLGFNFSMYMIILLTGVRMLVGEITPAFKGIQEKLIPNAVPAVDVAALLAFSPTAATLGFISTTIGTVLSMGILFAMKSPIMVIPGFTALFFTGAPIGVVSNKYGGVKAVIFGGLLLGAIQTFGSVWMTPLMGSPSGTGWTGMFDWTTVWPAITEIFRIIAKIFGMGPFAA